MEAAAQLKADVKAAIQKAVDAGCDPSILLTTVGTACTEKINEVAATVEQK